MRRVLAQLPDDPAQGVQADVDAARLFKMPSFQPRLSRPFRTSQIHEGETGGNLTVAHGVMLSCTRCREKRTPQQRWRGDMEGRGPGIDVRGRLKRQAGAQRYRRTRKNERGTANRWKRGSSFVRGMDQLRTYRCRGRWPYTILTPSSITVLVHV